jgi:hypothetical protein
MYMRNANDAPWERAEHFWTGHDVPCGRKRHVSTTTARARVDCKRCLASLAKRDRAFQRKARAGLQRVQWLLEAYGQIRGGLSDIRLAW